MNKDSSSSSSSSSSYYYYYYYYVPKLYAFSGKDISKCIEGGSMKLATQVDYVYM